MDEFVKSIDSLFESIVGVLDKVCGFLFGSLLEDDE